ncbi:DUF3047 domain-containing protein [Longibacter sp.]|uniref:DUF3047 domain-containing protein n=1 Tax=Longibacter sp. TaxID=2045415 RepID=UPI003EB7CD02
MRPTRLSPSLVRRSFGSGLVLIFLVSITGATVLLPDSLVVGDFSSGAREQVLPDEWDRITFGKIDTQTEYDLVEAPADSTVVLEARSNGGASGLVTEKRIDPAAYPVLQWRWRVQDLPDAANARTKDGDDFAARIYVTFDHDLGIGGRIKRTALRALGYDDVPSRALNYVWATRVDTGQVFPSAYTDWVMMLPLQSGTADLGRWVSERRNIADDYRRAFGEEPPAVTGIAVMTDTDNTGGSAVAYYGDIAFRRDE